jgi:alpha-N-arabinofuranosidase
MRLVTTLSRAAAVVTAGAFATLHATEFHISTNGLDTNPGTRRAPFRTIQCAANIAQPGDVITVHAGIYRERINPPRGGTSNRKRITYQAAPGEKAVLKGSEVVRGWQRVTNDTWKVTLPDSFFGAFNPYREVIRGDWFSPQGRAHHPGAVYLNGHWLLEAAKLEDVLKPAAEKPLWFAEHTAPNTTIWAQFKDLNPDVPLVEINVRQTVFYPDQPGRNFITVRGFTLEQAATPWAPPTAEQIGLIGTHWSQGWLIENNVIRYSRCSGVALGIYGD